ncbi:MAG: HAMP domain-containing histidine kinase [Bacteroidetes bacterium]|nr:HAMP domain-containing histidine kinase [Bacteroidota bacterium]
MKRSKLSGIVLLMAASGLLLMLFIGRWLQTEFTAAKEDLQKDIFEQFIDARSRVTDSILAKNLINPILNDSVKFKISSTTIQNSAHLGDTVQIFANSTIQDTVAEIVEFKGPAEPLNADNFRIEIRNDTVNQLVEGVKLFITEFSGKAGDHGIMREFMVAGDTSMLQAFFAQNLNDEDISVKPVWVSGRAEKLFPPPMFYYESRMFDTPYGVEIKDYNQFIFKSIIPEIIFGLILIAVITFAFIFSYRNIRNQMRLAVLKDDLISNISHELKTPVATVKVAIEALQQMDPVTQQDKMTNYLGMASQEVSRLDLLVNKVMNSILLDNGRQVFTQEEINPVTIVEEAITAMQIQAIQKGGHIKLTAPEHPETIIGDTLHIKGVVFNLIENSLKYSDAVPEIQVNIFADGTYVFITISDNGPGIPDDYKHKIFEKFFRVPSGNKHNIKGYGLGLYYAAEVMQQMGGTIAVKNNPDKGCTFTLTFPKA